MWVRLKSSTERGIFTSIPDLARKIRRYIKRYNEDPTRRRTSARMKLAHRRSHG